MTCHPIHPPGSAPANLSLRVTSIFLTSPDIAILDRGVSWSKLGSDAQTVNHDKPTLVLKLNDMDYYNIRATIVHEFGHALGLGHEHQHPEYWRNIKKFLSISNMKADLNVKDEVFDYQWTNNNPEQDALMSEYDEESVMHYQ